MPLFLQTISRKEKMAKKTIKTQGDFDKQMSQWQEELRDIMVPMKEREDKLCIELGELHSQKSDIIIQQQEQKRIWANICELKDIRDQKLECLALGRELKMRLAKVWAEINKKCVELRRIRYERKQAAQPYHDKMHELIMKYPKGSLPLIAR